MYFVEFRMTENADPWFLKGTAWTAQFERADKFETAEMAHAALAEARKFLQLRRGAKCKVIHQEVE